MMGSFVPRRIDGPKGRGGGWQEDSGIIVGMKVGIGCQTVPQVLPRPKGNSISPCMPPPSPVATTT